MARPLDPPSRSPHADFDPFLAVLPPELAGAVGSLHPDHLLEVVMDLGRTPEARMVGGVVALSNVPVTREQLEQVMGRLGPVGGDNRAGIEATLHRVSALRNRQGKVVGLTLRVGRAIYGTIDTLRDLVESGRNLLLLGRPGVGKTTKLREIARVLADDLGRRVMVVDTSNEIGGDGDVPHPGIGRARRMQVSRPDRQHDVMIEAVENHMPEAIVVDEIGTEAEAAAARTIAERGVQLVATAHGNTLENLVLNPTLSDLVGGVHTVTLSDDEAHRRGTQKTVSERRAPPTFDIVVELVSRDEVLVHPDTAEAVDRLLSGQTVGGERRKQGEEGQVEVEQVARAAAPLPPARHARPADSVLRGGTKRLYAHAVSRDLVERVLRDLRLDARVVRTMDAADFVLTLRSRANDPRMRAVAKKGQLQVLVLKRNSATEIRRALRNAFFVVEGYDEEEVREALQEAEHAIHRVGTERVPVPLAPRPPALRKLQHQLALRHHLESVSRGSEPHRHLTLFPSGAEPALTDGPLDEADGETGADLEAEVESGAGPDVEAPPPEVRTSEEGAGLPS